MAKTTVYDYTVYIKGLFGRNRKVKFEGFPMLRDSETQLSIEQVRDRLPRVLDMVKIKGDALVKVCEQKCEVENDSGFQIKTTTLIADSKTLIAEMVKGN